VKYFELDFPPVVREKTRIIAKHAALASLCGEKETIKIDAHGNLNSRRYKAMGMDLSQNIEKTESILTQYGLDKK